MPATFERSGAHAIESVTLPENMAKISTNCETDSYSVHTQSVIVPNLCGVCSNSNSDIDTRYSYNHSLNVPTTDNHDINTLTYDHSNYTNVVGNRNILQTLDPVNFHGLVFRSAAPNYLGLRIPVPSKNEVHGSRKVL